MTVLSRYDVNENAADLLGGILKNKLGVTDQKTLNDLETVLLSDTYAHYLQLLDKNEIIFSVDFLFKLHKYFLGTLYEWAGTTRKVNISKGGSMFAPIDYLPEALEELDKIILLNLPKPGDNK